MINADEVICNNMLRPARSPIECVFEPLEAKWSILTKKIGN